MTPVETSEEVQGALDAAEISEQNEDHDDDLSLVNLTVPQTLAKIVSTLSVLSKVIINSQSIGH